MSDLIKIDGSEVPYRSVMGYRTRYSTNGGYHRIDALIYVPAHVSHQTVVSYQVEREVRPEGWTIFVPVYIGLDRLEAHDAEQRVRELYRSNATLTE